MMQWTHLAGALVAVGVAIACSAPVRNDGAVGDGAPGSPIERSEPAQLISRNAAAVHSADSEARAREQRGATIGTVLLRNERLVIRAGADGPRFTVVTREGAIVSDDLDEASLAARHEHLFEVYSSAYARGAPYLDARLGAPARSNEPATETTPRSPQRRP